MLTRTYTFVLYISVVWEPCWEIITNVSVLTISKNYAHATYITPFYKQQFLVLQLLKMLQVNGMYKFQIQSYKIKLSCTLTVKTFV